jgi:hypothetical protein
LPVIPLHIERAIRDAWDNPKAELVHFENRCHVQSVYAAPGIYCWQITANSAADVQREMNRLMQDGAIEQSQFYAPYQLVDGRYRSRGYTCETQPAEAEAEAAE